MPTAKPHLASWERRLLAFALDAALQFVVLAVLLAVADSIVHSPPFLAALAAAVCLLYQSAALLSPRVGFGRMVAGISVISTRGSGEISRAQAIARPAIRVVMLGCAVLVAVGTRTGWIIVMPLVVEIALIAHTPWRQSIADLLAGTIVVETPQPQPHRAPAVPMYSATDEEFGPRP